MVAGGFGRIGAWKRSGHEGGTAFSNSSSLIITILRQVLSRTMVVLLRNGKDRSHDEEDTGGEDGGSEPF